MARAVGVEWTCLMMFVLASAAGCSGEAPSPTPTAAPTQAAATATPAPSTGTPSSGETPTPGPCLTLKDGSCVVETYHNPPELQPDSDGLYTLTLKATEVTLDGLRHCVRAYNGAYPGPTIVTPARVGEEQRHVRVDLKNLMQDHDFRDISGDDTCACLSSKGVACIPNPHHACDTPDPDCICKNSEGESCDEMFDFNVTNLHAHGSHVHPDYSRGGGCEMGSTGMGPMLCRECGGDVCDDDLTDDTCFYGDDVISTVHPREGARYRWDIDEDHTHHEGLDWYHPHIHGTTAIQVASGAAGAWIIRGPLDEVDGLKDAKERVLVFSTPPIVGDSGFAPLADGEACTDDTLTFNNFKVLGAVLSPQLNIINGIRRPRIVTPPDQVERWRFVHAGFLDEVFMGLFKGTDSQCTGWSIADEDVIPLTQIARDGITLPQSYANNYIFMSPGYRIEAVFGGEGVLKDGDTWCLVSGRFLQDSNDGSTGGPVSPATPPTPEEIRSLLGDGDLTLIVNVAQSAGPATETHLPDLAAIAALAPSTTLGGVPIEERCAQAAEVTDPAEIDQAAILQVGILTVDDPDPCDCPNYNVNCRNFELTDRSVYPYDRDLPLGEIQHWRVGASFDGHPFHIHINPYLVCPVPNPFDPLTFPHWRDTYLINTGRKIDLFTQYETYTGPFVFHCHKLTHEDDGMMQLIRICDPKTDATCGDYGWRQCAEDDITCLKAVAATECAISNDSEADTFACNSRLAAPDQICGPLTCVTIDDCPFGTKSCTGNICRPL